MVLGGQEGDSVGVRDLKERYWMRFLKGMVTDRNTLAFFRVEGCVIPTTFLPLLATKGLSSPGPPSDLGSSMAIYRGQGQLRVVGYGGVTAFDRASK
jgi:hypothetical protein